MARTCKDVQPRPKPGQKRLAKSILSTMSRHGAAFFPLFSALVQNVLFALSIGGDVAGGGRERETVAPPRRTS